MRARAGSARPGAQKGVARTQNWASGEHSHKSAVRFDSLCESRQQYGLDNGPLPTRFRPLGAGPAFPGGGKLTTRKEPPEPELPSRGTHRRELWTESIASQRPTAAVVHLLCARLSRVLQQ